jgi:hypothetical protein
MLHVPCCFSLWVYTSRGLSVGLVECSHITYAKGCPSGFKAYFWMSTQYYQHLST